MSDKTEDAKIIGELTTDKINDFFKYNGLNVYKSSGNIQSKICVYITGDYRTFDYCRYFHKYIIYDTLVNYDVYILLDETEDIYVDKLHNFFW